MNPALWVAKTGLDAQQTRLQVVSNNLANANTTGFKKDRAVFEVIETCWEIFHSKPVWVSPRIKKSGRINRLILYLFEISLRIPNVPPRPKQNDELILPLTSSSASAMR